MQTQTMEQHGALVMPFFSTYGGRKKLEVSDLRLPAGTELPPAEVASLGSRKLVDAKVIRHHQQPRDRAHAACQRVGVKFRRGVYFVPKDRLDDLCAELDTQVAEHRVRADDLRRHVADYVEAFAADHPRWADAIRRGAPKGDELSLSADYLVLPFEVVEGHGHEHLEASARKVSQTLFDEIALDASAFVRESIEGRSAADGVTQKALRPIRRMRDKLDGLAFLDSRVRPMVDAIDTTLETLPKTGKIQNRDFVALWALAQAMSDSDRLASLQHGLQYATDPMFASAAMTVVDDTEEDVAEAAGDEPGQPGFDDLQPADAPPRAASDWF